MTATYSDKYLLSTEPNFGNRVQQALVSACSSIGTEGWAVPFHRERSRYAAGVLNSPSVFKPMFIFVVSNDPNVISDATQAGTVALTAGNLTAQAALVTDAHIDNAISANFSNFFATPE